MEDAEFPKELFDGVQEAAGRSLNLTLRCRAQPEVKGEKADDKVLALASDRAFLLSAHVPPKVEHSFSYLDIQRLHSNKPTQVSLECRRGGPCTLWFSSQKDSDRVVGHVGSRLVRICPDMSLLKRFHVMPAERWVALRGVWERQGAVDLGPCGGFSDQYRAVCDNLDLVYREEVQWDVDTIYLSQDTTELNLRDFSHLDSRDLAAVVATLEVNKWFTGLVVRDYKLSTDVCEQILHVMSRSSCLEELVLENAGLRSDFAQKLSLALSANPASTLHNLNLSNNPLDDKGVCALSAQLGKLAKGLKQLNLGRTSVSSKGADVLCQALRADPGVAATLTHLRLSGNSLRGDELQNFLSGENRLEVLDLSSSDCSLEQTAGSLLKGCLKHLRVLNMSKTPFWHRKSREVPPSFKQFFSLSRALSSVDVSGCRLPAEALKALLLGLGCNPNLSDVSLDLSGCELRSAGSQILEGCIAEIPNISSLDISDNGLDGDLSTLLAWLAKNRSIRHLSLGRNFHNIKSKNVAAVLDDLVRMIQEEESPLTSLSLADSKLKGDLAVVLNALGSNTSLTKLDIRGNAMGDMGAKMLAKALQINTKLRTLLWDRNNVSARGLQEVASALETNFTIRFMPVPITDAAQALKTNPEKTEDALMKIEHFLLRNHETRKYLQEQAYRLQQGIVTSATQQLMDTMCVKVQDHLNSLTFTQSPTVRKDMKIAENLMTDARNSKTLLRNLYHLGGDGLRVAVRDKLESVAGEVSALMDEELETMLASMLEVTSGLCPHVMKTSGLAPDLLRACAVKMSVPRGFITKTLLEQTGVDILNKISELKLSAASLISDRIVDQILDSLSTRCHTLADHVSRQGRPALRPESQAETEVLDETVLDGEAQVEASVTTAKSKRKSILVRMVRPVSAAHEMELDLDQALQEVPVHVLDLPPSCRPNLAQPSFPPLASPPPLEHHTKVRPKARRRTKPRRVTCEAPAGSESQTPLGKVDEGVAEFFSKKVLNVSLKGAPAQVTTSNKRQLADKKRDSRGSGFFNLIKVRTSRSDKGQARSGFPAPTRSPISPALAPATPSVTGEPPPASPSSPRQPSPRFPKRNDEYSDTNVSAPSAGAAESDGPALPRHAGIPVTGADLLAEMKARQEKMAARKSQSPREDDDDDDRTGTDHHGPEAAPRSKTSALSPESPPGPSSPSAALGPRNSTTGAARVPIPAPRLRRSPTEHEGRDVLAANARCLPAAAPRRRWSSLKASESRPSPDGRRRAKSLPASRDGAEEPLPTPDSDYEY
ncbi:F-actin-uncapping protein LRRC16A-like isoform X2 [Syngnathoides biaculeatus]|uniref:F-actin-uncapping protein LRRC16A-like isoform X2 n=1 Tax=Syngnathoides biaculeatus TaxID=300417 RepID=UPI002ADE1699|nr:F-actin-uncapping protein LRRC16A-like isoform X2 [Syngnathoides biaculeatus]